MVVMEGFNPKTDTFEETSFITETSTSKGVPVAAKLLPRIEESEIQTELEAAVIPARYAGLGAYTANEAPLIYMN